MNYKVITLSALLIGFAFTVSGFGHGRFLAATDVSDAAKAADCRSCIDTATSTNELCYNTGDSKPYCCPAADIGAAGETNCAKTEATIHCQSETSDYPSDDGAYLWCSSGTYCGGTSDATLSETDDATTFEASNMPVNGICIYEIQAADNVGTDETYSYSVTLSDDTKATAKLYTKDANGDATFVGDLTADEAKLSGVATGTSGGAFVVVLSDAASGDTDGAAKITAQIAETPEDSGNIVGPAVYSLLLVLALMQIF